MGTIHGFLLMKDKEYAHLADHVGTRVKLRVGIDWPGSTLDLLTWASISGGGPGSRILLE